jgi:hypothetical protein
MKATKKPVEIDYMIYQGSLMAVTMWCESLGDKSSDHFFRAGRELHVKTLEGSSYPVLEGYVIIRGVQGEYNPCEPNIFKETYDTEDGEYQRYCRVNATKSLEELAGVIQSMADEQGMIQGRRFFLNANKMAECCENFSNVPANALTRRYGIRGDKNSGKE